MTRRKVMITLAILTAITLIGQYIMLGNTGIGQSKSSLPVWFWVLEQSLWGLRALVEVGVVIYIGMTTAQNNKQARILWTFKGGLIALIVITVGPVWAAYSLQESIIGILGRGGVIVWGLTLAGISATMLAGVSYAYKIQPFDYGLVALAQDEYNSLQQLAIINQDLLQTIAILEDQEQLYLAEKQGFANAVEFLRLLPATKAVELLYQFDSNLEPGEVAEATGLAISTVKSVRSRQRNGQ